MMIMFPAVLPLFIVGYAAPYSYRELYVLIGNRHIRAFSHFRIFIFSRFASL